jgi:4-hydroxybenzoate polyprenyltransferase
MLKKISNMLRWRDWGPGKLPVMFSLLIYIGLSGNRLSSRFALQCFLLIIAAAVHCAFGYLVNEWGDRELDNVQGKRNVFRNTKPLHAKLILVGLLTLACMSLMPFFHIKMVAPLWVCWVFLAWAYSLKPIRLKERGLWGLLTSTTAQWTFPVLLAFAVFEQFGGWDMIALTAALSVSGGTLEIGHQRYDRQRDQVASTGTLGVRMQPEKLNAFYKGALLMDKACVGITLLILSTGLSKVFPWSGSIGPLWPLLFLYIILLSFSIRENVHGHRTGIFIDPYYSTTRNSHKFLHETIPNLITPAYLIILAATAQHIFIVLLAFFLVWRIIGGVADWRWPFQFMKNLWRR